MTRRKRSKLIPKTQPLISMYFGGSQLLSRADGNDDKRDNGTNDTKKRRKTVIGKGDRCVSVVSPLIHKEIVESAASAASTASSVLSKCSFQSSSVLYNAGRFKKDINEQKQLEKNEQNIFDDDSLPLLDSDFSDKEHVSMENVSPPSSIVEMFPMELWLHVFSFLLPIEICKIGCVCRSWRLSILNASSFVWARWSVLLSCNEEDKCKNIDYFGREYLSIASIDTVNLDDIHPYIVQFFNRQHVPCGVSANLMKTLLYASLKSVLDPASVHMKSPSPYNGEMSLTWSGLGVLAWACLNINDPFELSCIIANLKDANISRFLYAVHCLLKYFEYKVDNGIVVIRKLLYFVEHTMLMTREKYRQLETIALDDGQSGSINVQLSDRHTTEQRDMILYDIPYGMHVCCMAFAGSGKTSTLKAYADIRPTWNILYIAFNKAIQMDAGHRFSSNVKCRTMHSLAYEAVGHQFFRCIIFDFDILKITKLFTINKSEAKEVCKTLKNFFSSIDRKIMIKHVTSHYFDMNKILDHASRLWSIMIDTNDNSYGITHDGYLKLWQLSRPDLSSFDAILIDEAQDLTPAVGDILCQQKCRKLFVGDPHQQIYSFRGAVNVLCDLAKSAIRVFTLSQSFRFGPDIGFVVSSFLYDLKGEKRFIFGANSKSITDATALPVRHTWLCRTNAGVFSSCVDIMMKKKSFHIIGGIKSFMFDNLLDLLHLQSGNISKISSKFYSKFESLNSLQEYAKRCDDHSTLGNISIVLKYGSVISDLVPEMKLKCCNNASQAEIIVTNVHKAKGLEWDTVILQDDFVDGWDWNCSESIRDQSTGLVTVEFEELVNLLYVAMTRSKRILHLNSAVLDVLGRMGISINPTVGIRMK